MSRSVSVRRPSATFVLLAAGGALLVGMTAVAMSPVPQDDPHAPVRAQQPARAQDPATTTPGDATAAPAADSDALVVDRAGLVLYPRWSKAFPPLAELPAGSVLDVQRSTGAWKEVVVRGTATRGWVFCEVAPPAASEASTLQLPIAASPTTSGLVVKGFSPRAYALRNGSDPDAVAVLAGRRLDAVRFAAFLDEDPPPAGGPSGESAPTSLALTEVAEAAAERGTSGGPPGLGKNRPEGARDLAGKLPPLGGSHGDTVAQLEQAKQNLAARAALHGDLLALIGDDGEVTLGEAVSARVLGQSPEVTDEGLLEYVAFVGLRLADGVPGRAGTRWRFSVLESPEVNAFSTAGGFVFVTRGALAVCHDEAQLAALLAHEMAHVAYRHSLLSLEASRERLVFDAARTELTSLMPDDPAMSRLVDDLSAVGDELYEATRVSYAPAMEREADALALHILARAGYDPSAAVQLLESLAVASGPGAVRCMGSHPPPAERVDVLRAVLARDGLAPRGSRNAARFEARVPGER